MSQLPEQPWSEGDTFTNDATGVEYTFDGVKWLASGGEELDLSGFVTDAQLVAVEDASVMRDEVLDGKIEQESNLNTVAHLKLEDQIQWLDTHYQQGDQKLQDQIDELEANAGDYVSKTGGDSMQGPLVVQAQDGANGRETNKVQTLGVYSNSDGSALRLGTTRDRVYVGHNDTAFNGPIKVDEIQEKTADEGILLSNHTVLAEEGAEPNHLITKGYVDSSIAAIEFPETDLDDCVKQSDSWDMGLGTTLGVNQLKPLEGGTPFVYYEPTDYNSTHPCGIVNRGLMENYVGDAIDGIDFPEADLSGYVSKSGDEMTGQLTIKKSTQVALDIIGDGNESQIKFWSSGAVALQKYTAFKDNELVTKKYVDDKVGSGGGSSFTPGDQVAKTDGESANVGGFWVSNGALYCKVN